MEFFRHNGDKKIVFALKYQITNVRTENIIEFTWSWELLIYCLLHVTSSTALFGTFCTTTSYTYILQNTMDSCIPLQIDAAVMCGTHVYQIQWNNAMQRPLRRSRSFKVTDVGTNRKLMYDFLLVINSNVPPILHRFQDMAQFSLAGGECLTLTLSLGVIPC